VRQLNVRLDEGLLERVRVAAGPRGVSAFVREALEAKLGPESSSGPSGGASAPSVPLSLDGLVPGSKAWFDARQRRV